MRARPRVSSLVNFALSTIARIASSSPAWRSALRAGMPAGPDQGSATDAAFGCGHRTAAAFPVRVRRSRRSGLSRHAVSRDTTPGAAPSCPTGNSIRPAIASAASSSSAISCAAHRRSREPPRMVSTAGSPLRPDDPRRAARRAAAYCSAAWRYLRLRLTSARPTAGMFCASSRSSAVAIVSPMSGSASASRRSAISRASSSSEKTAHRGRTPN